MSIGSDYHLAKKEEPKMEIKFIAVSKTRLKPFTRFFPGYGDMGMIKCEFRDTLLPSVYNRFGNAESVYNFKPRKDDVWVITFPKCGTTWTQELIWLLVNNCDTEAAAKVPLMVRSPYLDFHALSDPDKITPELKNAVPSPEAIAQLPSPQVIKSHLPFHLLHPDLLDTCKVIYVARNPKDVMVSYYFHHKLVKWPGFTGNMEEFVQYFMNDEVLYAPFILHILGAWDKRHHPNLHIIFYEDMKRNLKGEIKRAASFLNKSLTEEELNKLANHLHIDTFAKNESANFEIGKKTGLMNLDAGNFVRKGKTGDWKNHFSSELNQRIDEWIEKNLAGTDLKFVTDLDNQD